MITEQYVSFETAKLLKEKGFDLPDSPFSCQQEQDTWVQENSYSVPNPDYDETLPFDSPNMTVTVPHVTQSLVMRWLREVYGLFIEIHTFYESEELPFACRYQIISNNKDYESMEDESDECFYTYEEAVEAAITECLECYL